MHTVESSRRETNDGRASLAGVIVLTFVIRLVVLIAFPAGLSIDTDGYRRLAVVLRTTGILGVRTESNLLDEDPGQSAPIIRPTAYRPPVYPYLLSAFVSGGTLSPLAVGLLHVVLGCGTVAIVVWLGRKLGLGRWSLLAGIMTACDPILLYQSAQIMTETIAAFCAVVALAGLSNLRLVDPATEPDSSTQICLYVLLRAAGAGLVLGLACLCRPTFLPWCLLIVASMLTNIQGRRSVAQVVAVILGIVVAIFPWGLRNYRQLGVFTVSTTHGGYTLLLGNNPSFYQYLWEAPWGAVWKSDELDAQWTAQRTSDEVADDRLAYQWAKNAIRDDPRMFVWSCWVRVGRLWNVLPHRIVEPEPSAKYFLRIATASWYCVIYALAVFALVRHWDSRMHPIWRSGLLLCLAFTLVHAVYWSDMRMRAPLMPFVYLVAATAFPRPTHRI